MTIPTLIAVVVLVAILGALTAVLSLVGAVEAAGTVAGVTMKVGLWAVGFAVFGLGVDYIWEEYIVRAFLARSGPAVSEQTAGRVGVQDARRAVPAPRRSGLHRVRPGSLRSHRVEVTDGEASRHPVAAAQS